MDRTGQEKRRGWTTTMAIFALALLLSGCGRERIQTAENEEPSVESTEESVKQTESMDTEEIEMADTAKAPELDAMGITDEEYFSSLRALRMGTPSTEYK